MSTLASARAVLSDAVDRDQLDDAFAQGTWRLINVIEAGPGHPAQLIFARDAHHHVHVVDDQQLGLTYLAAQGEDGQEAIAELSDSLPCYSSASARADLANATPPARARALGALVLLEPEAPDLESMIIEALRDPSVTLRVAGLTAAAYAPRPVFRDHVTALRDADPEPKLREAAERVIAALPQP